MSSKNEKGVSAPKSPELEKEIVSILDLDEAEVLSALYETARGDAEPLTLPVGMAKALLFRDGKIIRLNGRILSLNFPPKNGPGDLDVRVYNQVNGKGLAQKIIGGLR